MCTVITIMILSIKNSLSACMHHHNNPDLIHKHASACDNTISDLALDPPNQLIPLGKFKSPSQGNVTGSSQRAAPPIPNQRTQYFFCFCILLLLYTYPSSAIWLKPVLNWANVCSPNILRTVRRTMIRFLIDSSKNWQFEEFACSQLACNEMQASAWTCGRQHGRKCRLKSGQVNIL